MRNFKKIPWAKSLGILVPFVGFIGAIITIYSYFSQQRIIDLRYEILSNTNILDIRGDASQFDIMYDGKSLKATNENVKIISFRVINVGNTDILKTFYDENDPLGFIISNGIFLKKPEIIETSNKYLRDNLKVFSDSTNKINFSSIILESSEYFIIKVIFKYNLNEASPTIHSIGKIAGVKSIEVLNSVEQKATESFFSTIFSGGILIQLSRSFGYSLIVIIFVVIITIFGSVIISYLSKKGRKRFVNFFKFDPKYTYNKMDDAIFNRFIDDDVEILNTMRRYIKKETLLNAVYKYALIAEKRGKKYPDIIHRSSFNHILNEGRFNRRHDIIEKMITDGLVIKQENKLIINSSMKNTLEQFVVYLKENNYKSQDKSKTINDTDIEVTEKLNQ